MEERTFKPLAKITNTLINILLFFITICIFVPFSSKMPNASLDSSWAYGLNHAVAQGFAFGKQIIFTLGPYSSIYTKAYHPATNSMMMWGSFYLACSYCFIVVLLTKNTPRHWVLGFGIVLLIMLYARDSLFFSYPLLVALFCITNIDSQKSVLINRYPFILILLAFLPFGLLFLIKGSSLILCVVISFLCFFYFILAKQRFFAIICLFSPMISMMFFWCISGQSLLLLPRYITSTLYLSSKFTEAMASDSNINEVLLYLITSLFILLTVMMQKQIMGIKKLFLVAAFFIFLFISFKAGFTRAEGHTFIPGSSILIAGIFLPIIFNLKGNVIVVICSLATWYYINSHYTTISLQRNFLSIYSAAWYGLKNRIEDKNGLSRNFELSVNLLKNQANFPVFKGTTDIYPHDLSYLIASENSWSPRPIFQSYSVFTRSLAKKNKKHLQNSNGPDNIIFKIDPIDMRLPSLEDGISWYVLLTQYQPSKMEHDFLFLHKKKLAQPKQRRLNLSPTLTDMSLICYGQESIFKLARCVINNIFLFQRTELQPFLNLKALLPTFRDLIAKSSIFDKTMDSAIKSRNVGDREEFLIRKESLNHMHYYSLGEKIDIPKDRPLVFVRVDIKPTLWGQLITLLYKPEPLKITLYLKNNSQKHFRISANMAKSDFLISPLIEHTDEFFMLYTKNAALHKKDVLSFTITTHSSKNWQWHSRYQIYFKN